MQQGVGRVGAPGKHLNLASFRKNGGCYRGYAIPAKSLEMGSFAEAIYLVGSTTYGRNWVRFVK